MLEGLGGRTQHQNNKHKLTSPSVHDSSPLVSHPSHSRDSHARFHRGMQPLCSVVDASLSLHPLSSLGGAAARGHRFWTGVLIDGPAWCSRRSAVGSLVFFSFCTAPHTRSTLPTCNFSRPTVCDRRVDHRCMQISVRHRQARQGRTPPAAHPRIVATHCDRGT